jgi:hypothetical protein
MTTEEDIAAQQAPPTVEFAPGALFTGKTISIPSRYEGLSGVPLTLQHLKDSGNTEWFRSHLDGRREGEEKTFMLTRYDLTDGSSISARIPHSKLLNVNTEEVKQRLRYASEHRDELKEQCKVSDMDKNLSREPNDQPS